MLFVASQLIKRASLMVRFEVVRIYYCNWREKFYLHVEEGSASEPKVESDHQIQAVKGPKGRFVPCEPGLCECYTAYHQKAVSHARLNCMKKARPRSIAPSLTSKIECFVPEMHE